MTSPTAWRPVSACQWRPGVRAWKSTGSASSAPSAPESLTASARAKRSPAVATVAATDATAVPPSVAERGRGFIADPFPQRHGAAERSVLHQRVLAQVPGVEADGADQEPASGFGVALGQLRQW